MSWLSTALPMESSSRYGRDRVREERSLSQGATQNATTAPQPAKKRSLRAAGGGAVKRDAVPYPPGKPPLPSPPCRAPSVLTSSGRPTVA